MKTEHHTLDKTARLVEKCLTKHRIAMTMGGEPTYVPEKPEGIEWSVSAVGPTKLAFAYKLADRLLDNHLQGAAAFFSPGKLYPGETNPRWAVHLLGNRDGISMVQSSGDTAQPATAGHFKAVTEGVLKTLRLEGEWLKGLDGLRKGNTVGVLPLDHDGKRWITQTWNFPGKKSSVPLIDADAPSGLRLPLQLLPADSLRRALTIELVEGQLHIFFPPLLQKPFLRLLGIVNAQLKKAGGFQCRFEGYIPEDVEGLWTKLSLTADPGVLEINLPPCNTWVEYRDWLHVLETEAREVGLFSHKVSFTGAQGGTGGGNHLLFGGPDLDRNPFFSRPQWLAATMRYWQAHPALSYLFTGNFVGPSSQAPRPDESSRELYDLEMAYRYLDALEPGDHRYIINETLRHMHIDTSGNTHRTEISFDKFWNTTVPNGACGLIEFRAIETMPRADWMAAVALLWRSIFTMLLERKKSSDLIVHGGDLHDKYFLPSFLWEDLTQVLADLRRAGFPLPAAVFREIWRWRFPEALVFEEKGARLVIRRALEGWPLLCEIPVEGGSTSRFVDTSIERMEISANAAFTQRFRIFLQGREVPLHPFPEGRSGAGVRFRNSALYPCLHPGIPPHLPLDLTFAPLKSKTGRLFFRLTEGESTFSALVSSSAPAFRPGRALRARNSSQISYDLRGA